MLWVKKRLWNLHYDLNDVWWQIAPKWCLKHFKIKSELNASGEAGMQVKKNERKEKVDKLI